MGRMFRIISEGSGGGAVGLAEPPAAPAAADGVPFVEVGGPDGVVTSVQRSVRRPAPPPTPVPEPTPPPAVIPGPDLRHLSVSFHRLPAGVRPTPTGVAADLIAFHHPDHAVSREYLAIRDEVRRQFDVPGPRAVVLTAAAAEAGVTTVALNLAATIARDGGAKVLVVDAHPARPGVARRVGAADGPGLGEVLGQQVPLAWAVQATPVPGLHALTAGTYPASAAQMAVDFPRLMSQLRQWFDWVIVDAGVWGDGPGRGVTGTVADAVYLVTRQADIDHPGFTGLRAAVTADGGHVRGYVTTRA